jgi:uncharacterized membrane-anchored protein
MSDGGLGLGTTVTGVVFLLVIRAVVGQLAVSRRDRTPPLAAGATEVPAR